MLVNFDMEQYALKDLTHRAVPAMLRSDRFPAGLALQAYLRSGQDDAAADDRVEPRTGRQVTVRLIKGAYWDYEVIHAEQMGWPVPVWTGKRDTDACFERMAGLFVAAMPRRPGQGGVKLAVGSHNIRSIARPWRWPKKGSAANRPSKCKSSTAWPIRSRRRSSTAAFGCANTCPWDR